MHYSTAAAGKEEAMVHYRVERETGNQSRANASCSAPNTIPSDANVPECNAFAMEHQAVLLIKSQ